MRPILIGIAQALVFKKSFYTPTTDNNIFSKKMRAIIKFSNLIVIPSRKILDLDQIPQVRKKIMIYSRFRKKRIIHILWEKTSMILLSFYLCMLKFIYSEKATKFCEIFTLLLSYAVQCQSKVR